jgi:hypothetical protein
MMAEKVVATVLLENAAVVAAVSERIYLAGKAPQEGARPYLTYQRISSSVVVGPDLEGGYGLDAIRVQVNAWDNAFGGNAAAVAQKVRQALHGKSGPGPGQQSIECSAPVDFDPDEKLQLEGARVDAIVTMNEAAEAA